MKFVCRLACDSERATARPPAKTKRCPIGVLYVGHLQKKGKAYICNFRGSQCPHIAIHF
jgi:hypothetical protein